MNKLLPFLIFIFGATSLIAQNVVIDGVTFSADKKTLIKYPVDKVGEEYVVPEGTEIIGTSAFEFANVFKVTVPSTLKEINDFAFKDCHSLKSFVWKKFPKIGNSIFWNSFTQFEISDDNNELALINGVLFSIDQKRLLLHPPVNSCTFSEYNVPEGTEVINERAFDGVEVSNVILPASLLRIENLAFRVRRGIPVRTPNYHDYFMFLETLVCKSPVPPLLIGDPFVDPQEIELRVPNEYIGIYKEAPLWSEFKGIYGLSVKKQMDESTKVWFDGQTVNVQSDQLMKSIKLYNSTGILLQSYTVCNSFYNFDINQLSHNLFLIKICYANEYEDVFKFSN